MRWLLVVSVALAAAGAGRALHRQLFALVAPSAARNAAYSPAATRLALQVARACAGGRTRQQLDALLAAEGGGEVAAGAVGDLDRDGVALELSAGLFYDKRAHVRDDFADAQVAAGVLMCPLDLEHRYALSRSEIERWVHNRTRGHVRLPDGVVHARAALVLLSAVSLRGRWLNPFVPFVTKPLPFRNVDLTESVVPTMQQIVYTPYADLDDLQARGVLLPFENERFHLMLLLPDDEFALADLENRLRAVECAALAARFASRMVHVRVPRFRAEASVALADALRAAGAADLFAADAADLSAGLGAGARGRALDALAQAVFLDVREGGAEMDAATAAADAAGPAPQALLALAGPAAPPPRLRFHVDRPFLFYVLPHPNPNGDILLQGRVVRM